MKLKPSESVEDQARRMGREDFAKGISREIGQEAWMPNSLARVHWLEGWDKANTMSKPKLLDLFCGAGGCTKGYQQSGFWVRGVDMKPQPHYIGEEFIQADALEYLESLITNGEIKQFAAIHASPPCQAYMIARNNGCHKDAPRLIDPARELLLRTGLPYVVENVAKSPLADHSLFGTNMIVLCGASFGLRSGKFDLARHRKFKTNWPIVNLPCNHRPGFTIGVYGNGTNRWHREKFGRCITDAEKREAMNIDWMSRKELTQAIPPAYTEFIGTQLRNFLVHGTFWYKETSLCNTKTKQNHQ